MVECIGWFIISLTQFSGIIVYFVAPDHLMNKEYRESIREEKKEEAYRSQLIKLVALGVVTLWVSISYFLKLSGIWRWPILIFVFGGAVIYGIVTEKRLCR